MLRIPHRARLLPLVAVLAMPAGCDEVATLPLEPGEAELRMAAENQALATLRRATARYHDLDAALADGFFLLHECEVRPGEGAVGLLYIHLERYLDGQLDPASPDGLLYAPAENGKPTLAGVELAIPMSLWTSPDPPEFFGIPFQAEEEFGAFGLHVWLWMHNPQGLFAQAHPGIECGPENGS